MVQNLYKDFRQAVESPKKLKFNGLNLSKKCIPSAKTLYTEIYLTSLSTSCVKIHQTTCHLGNHKSFFTTQLICIILAQTLHTFDKNIPSKCKFSDFPLLKLKPIKFLITFFKQKVSFSSKFEALFSVMRDNSSALF